MSYPYTYQTLDVMFLQNVTISYIIEMMVMTEYMLYELIHIETVYLLSKLNIK